MNWSDLAQSLDRIWEEKPVTVGLLVVVFVFVVVDAWLLKRRKRRRHPRKY